MIKVKTIALVAHDNQKLDLMEWVNYNASTLLHHQFVCTGTTGNLIEEVLTQYNPDKANKIKKLRSGPLGGDQEMGALIAGGHIDMMFFFWDPMQPQPHDVDVKALLRLAVLYNIPIANNRSTADFIISSPLMQEDYRPILKDYSAYINRSLKDL